MAWKFSLPTIRKMTVLMVDSRVKPRARVALSIDQLLGLGRFLPPTLLAAPWPRRARTAGSCRGSIGYSECETVGEHLAR